MLPPAHAEALGVSLDDDGLLLFLLRLAHGPDLHPVLLPVVLRLPPRCRPCSSGASPRIPRARGGCGPGGCPPQSPSAAPRTDVTFRRSAPADPWRACRARRPTMATPSSFPAAPPRRLSVPAPSSPSRRRSPSISAVLRRKRPAHRDGSPDPETAAAQEEGTSRRRATATAASARSPPRRRHVLVRACLP